MDQVSKKRPASEMQSPTEDFSSIDEHDSSTSQDEEDTSSYEAYNYEDDQEVAAVVMSEPDHAYSNEPTDETTVIHSRAYQIEMYEKSLEQNVIVVMDTGSGKTQVAVLRIQAELKKNSDKLIWFLAPTVALCEQQFRFLKSQLGAAQIKFLSGADNVDTWSSTTIWNDYLANVRVMVSTYQVLLDAVMHGFVQITRLGLIIFDEAHNCTGKHAGSRIMDQYRIQKQQGMPCPAILGLTASPIMKSNLNGIQKIELTLDAICTTPSTHREELMRVANRPVLICVDAPPSADAPTFTPTNASLSRVYRDLNILNDPYILNLQRGGSERQLDKLRRAIERWETPVNKQLQSFSRKSLEICRELGCWASDSFIYQGIIRFMESLDQPFGPDRWTTEEKEYLANILRQVEIRSPLPLQNVPVDERSNKFNALVQQLESAPDGTRCMIFCLETAVVALLVQMLSAITSVNRRFRVGSLVGVNYSPKHRRDLGELNESKGTVDLEKFKEGTIDILVATSVAEEGIDVPSCDLIISFNAPANLKSFIQRRGRARMENSKFILIVDGSSYQHEYWQSLEEMMRMRYEDEMRLAHELATLEESSLDPELAPLRIPSTGAQLDFDQARSHLSHFCQKITSGQYTDHHPYYISKPFGDPSNGDMGFSAVVHLPSSLPQEFRRVKSHRHWRSEKNAFKDAAFQAFKAIYVAGLINDHLMPLTEDPGGILQRSPMMSVNPPWSPWVNIAQRWKESTEIVQREVLLKDGDAVIARFDASLPDHFPKLSPFKIHWEAGKTFTIETSEESRLVTASSLKPDQSAALILMASGHRWPIQDLPHILHLRLPEDIAFGQHVRQPDDIAFGQHVGQPDAIDDASYSKFLVRDRSGTPYIFVKSFACKPPPEVAKHTKQYEEEGADAPWLALKKWPRRQDWLHPISEGRSALPVAVPLSHCTVDTVDLTKAYIGSFMPSILHMLEIRLLTEELCNTILKDVGFSDISLVTTAISARAAQEATDYERLEFLGDSTLKILATLAVMIEHPDYPEGYLSAMKDRIVSNSRLCLASADQGLAQFILARTFTARKWKPCYIESFSLTEETIPPTNRDMSTKTLADVVESLTGAALLDGGLPRALTCLRILLPEVQWYDLPDARKILYETRDFVMDLSPTYQPLEELIGYKFRNKGLLLEAISHGCLNMYTEPSMERLEFLGDSILDTIIVTALWAHDTELKNHEMHLLRTASVNADFLGFLVMEWHVMQEKTSISPSDRSTIVSQERVPFWKFMRHRSYEVAKAQEKANKRHLAERETILELLDQSNEHPWAQLAHLEIPKFMSDMFESVLGAVWVDSGSLAECENVAERAGILPYLRRLMKEKRETRHPKNKLGELAGWDRKKVKYETEYRKRNGEDDLVCRVFVADELIVEVNRGVNEDEIVAKAAHVAYHMLRGRTKKIRTKH